METSKMKVYWFGGNCSIVYGGVLVCARSIKEARALVDKTSFKHNRDSGEEMPMLQTTETEPKVLISDWDCC